MLVSLADSPEAQSSTNLKPRREPLWVPPLGLTHLFEPANPKTTVADVVFVHGLQGHPYKTWRYKGKVEKKVHDEVGTFRSLFYLFSFWFPSSVTIDSSTQDWILSTIDLVKARLNSSTNEVSFFFEVATALPATERNLRMDNEWNFPKWVP